MKFQSKNIINIIAQRWKELSPEEKLEWKQRAQTLSELELNNDEKYDATEGDLNHDTVIQDHHDATHDNPMLLVGGGESHPPNSIHNLHPVPVAPTLELGNHTQNVENVHNFAPIDIGIQLQMQMTNALDNHGIMNDSTVDNHERLQDIHAAGMIQDPHVFRF